MSAYAGVRAAIDALNGLNIPYMVVGSLSSNYYAIPRSTRDADFVIETDEKIGLLRERLAPEFRMDPQVGFKRS